MSAVLVDTNILMYAHDTAAYMPKAIVRVPETMPPKSSSKNANAA